MAKYTAPKYPDILTMADWAKKKGVFAKMHGETGIGAAMTQVKQAFDKVGWKKVELCSEIPTVTTTIGVQKFWTDANGEHTNITALDSALRSLESLATTTHAKFKASKTIPSSAAEHVKKVQDEAKKLNYATTWATIVGSIKPAYEAAQKLAVTNDEIVRLRQFLAPAWEQLKGFQTAVNKLHTFVKQFLDTAKEAKKSGKPFAKSDLTQTATKFTQTLNASKQNRGNSKNSWFALKAAVTKLNKNNVTVLYQACEKIDAGLRENGDGTEKKVRTMIAEITGLGASMPAAKPDWATFMDLKWPCTYEEMRSAYKKLSLKYHPDKNPGKEKEAGENMKKLNASHEAAAKFFGK